MLQPNAKMKQLKQLEKEQLLKLLTELASLNKENTNFLKLKLQNKPDEALIYYKKKIKEALWQERINLREARKYITDFKKISKETEHLLELMVFYVETGESVDNEYGDMYEAFYCSMETMFEQVVKTLNAHPEFTPKFKERLTQIVNKSCEGWAHKDTLVDIYEELQ